MSEMSDSMRRKDREINDFKEIESIIRSADVCRLGMLDDDEVYVVPVNFGYSNRTLYIHSARSGRKIDILKRNPDVCVEFDIDHQLMTPDNPAEWSMKYRSVIAWGKVEFLNSPDMKAKAFEIIFAQYTAQRIKIPEDQLKHTIIFKIPLTRITGKKHV